MPIRPFQGQAVEASVAAFDKGILSQVITLPTGTGKTVVGTELPRAYQIKPNERVIWFVQKDELAQQAARSFAERWPQATIGIEMERSRADNAQIVIASIPSLQKKRLADFNVEAFRLHNTDECIAGDQSVTTDIGRMRIDDPRIVDRKVFCFDESSNTWTYRKVLRWIHQGAKPTIIITTETKASLQCTSNHKIMTAAGWKEAGALNELDLIVMPNVFPNKHDRVVRTDPAGSVDVFDLEVEEHHNFVANGMLAHNCHHSPATSYLNVYRKFHIMKGENPDPRRVHVGFTATPNRADNIRLDSVFEKVVFPYPGSEYAGGLLPFIKRGYLADIVAYRVETRLDITKVKSLYGDFVASQLARVVNTPARNRIAVDEYLEASYGGALQGLAFTSDIAHTEALAQAFKDRGVQAFGLSSNTKKYRRQAIEAYQNGDLQVLVSANMLTEGVDLPGAVVGIMACPTRSSLKYRQCVGRLTRPNPAPEVLAEYAARGERYVGAKRQCRIIDLVDVSSKHQLHTAPTLFGLNPKFNANGDSLTEAQEKVRAAQAEFSIAMEDIVDLAQLENVRSRINLLASQSVPAEIKKLSKFAWIAAGPGAYRISLPKITLSVETDTLGQCTIYKTTDGVSMQAGEAPTLKSGIDLAESMIPADLQRMGKAKAGWRTEPSTGKQHNLLWRVSDDVRGGFDTYEDFTKYAGRLSKGAMSILIDKYKN